ncbi:molecular chaperone [Vibrio metschnikovii]|uniref:fimbrial biogenesis chaperone n=1 Tax=Vibrio metschnikovii TaxID=28172 RepID=UPI002FC70549
MNISKIFILTTIIFFCSTLNASVVMTGSRVVYPAHMKEKNIQFKNNDSFPSLVQLWVDEGNIDSTPDNSDAPFIILPSVFKIGANSGQSVRLVYIGDSLPNDRESVFYLNELQIPSVSKDIQDNKLLVMLKNRVKLFYRPDGLSVDKSEISNMLEFSFLHKEPALEIKNTSPYYVSFNSLYIKLRNEQIKFIPDMVPPFDRIIIPINDVNINRGEDVIIEFAIINDLGAIIKNEKEVKF